MKIYGIWAPAQKDGIMPTGFKKFRRKISFLQPGWWILYIIAVALAFLSARISTGAALYKLWFIPEPEPKSKPLTSPA